MFHDALNRFAAAILDTLDVDGIPESYLALAAEHAGATPAADAIAILISGGLLERRPGPIVVPGPEFARVARAMRAAAGGVA